MQEAVAVGFETELSRLGSKECYFTAFADELEPKRDMTAEFLHEAGLKPTIPEGGYFIIAETSGLGLYFLKWY